RRARSPLVRRRTTIVLTLSLVLVPLVGCGSGHKTATSTTRPASPRNDGAPPSTRRAATPVVATPGIITTVAGSGGPGHSGDGGPAVAAGLFRPTGLAVSPSGDLYIADSQNGRVRKVGRDGIISDVTRLGGSSFGDPSGTRPSGVMEGSGVATDKDG